MSLHNAQEFLKTMQKDDSLWLTAKQIKTTEEHRQFAQSKGFDFSDEELKKALDIMLRELVGSAKTKNPKKNLKQPE